MVTPTPHSVELALADLLPNISRLAPVELAFILDSHHMCSRLAHVELARVTNLSQITDSTFALLGFELAFIMDVSNPLIGGHISI